MRGPLRYLSIIKLNEGLWIDAKPKFSYMKDFNSKKQFFWFSSKIFDPMKEKEVSTNKSNLEKLEPNTLTYTLRK